MTALTVDQVLTGQALGITGDLSDFLVLDFGGTRMLYALSRSDNALIQIQIGGSGALGPITTLALSGTYVAGIDAQLGHVGLANGTQRLVIAGLPATDGQSVTLTGAGALGTQETLQNVGALIAPVGALVSGTSQGGLALFAPVGAGFAPVDTLDDTAGTYLADTSASVSFTQNSADFIATTSALEDGLNIVQINAGGIVQTGAIGAAQGMPVNGPSDVGLIQRLDETLLVVAGHGSSSVSTLRVVGGAPILADHILDSETTRFQAASTIATATFGDFAFVVAGGADGGVSLFTALPGGRLVHLDTLQNDETVPLDGISALAALVTGSALRVFAGSDTETGLASLSYDLSALGEVRFAAGDGSSVSGTSGDDQIMGASVGEALFGLAGDDILFDGAGADTLTGGAGADLFVLAADSQPDTILDFQRGQDKLDLSAFDFLYDTGDLTITTTATGATLSHGDEVIHVTTADGQPLTSADFANDDILNVDRPPVLPIGQELVGGNFADSLTGGAGPDTVYGFGGADDLSGGFGSDLLFGGSENDLLNGGAGQDALHGQAGDDTLIGGFGDDLLMGNAGNDVIYGDDPA